MTDQEKEETIQDEVCRKAEKNRRRNRLRRERDDAMRSIGMVKVKGALGGTYWE